MNIQERDRCYIAHTYDRYPLTITHGKGCRVYDEAGRSYLDMTSGIGVNAFGYGEEGWRKTIHDQVDQLVHSSNLYTNRPEVEAAELLCRKSGCQKVFFTNSGAESNEGAIKAARKYSHDRYGQDRYEIITLCHSFHGRTITTLSATGQDVFHQHYMPFTPGFVYVNPNDVDDLRQKVNERTCAIMLEVVQGESGVHVLHEDFLSAVQTICDMNDILLIIDEVQSGIGRCGSLFAYEQFSLHPDIVTCAKALGAGLPIGAILLYDKVKDVFHYGDHGTTFGGNALACAASCYVLRRCNDTLYESIKENGSYLRSCLKQLPHVKAVSGLGLMLGVELEHTTGKEVAKRCLDQGVLFLTAKERLRLLPPLIITKQEITEAMTILETVLREV